MLIGSIPFIMLQHCAVLCITTHCVSSVCDGWLFDGLLWGDDLQVVFFQLLHYLVVECLLVFHVLPLISPMALQQMPMILARILVQIVVPMQIVVGILL